MNLGWVEKKDRFPLLGQMLKGLGLFPSIILKNKNKKLFIPQILQIVIRLKTINIPGKQQLSTSVHRRTGGCKCRALEPFPPHRCWQAGSQGSALRRGRVMGRNPKGTPLGQLKGGGQPSKQFVQTH